MSRQRIVVIVLLVGSAAALGVLQRRQVHVEISPRPLLYLVADTQRELERIPLQLTRLSDAEENQIGEELARRWRLTPARHKGDAQRIAEYVNRVGQNLRRGVERPNIRYRFHYVDEERFVNAGALPGGQIAIGRGLLQILENEDELAAILAHEIAHVDRRHAVERLQYEVKARKLGVSGLYGLGRIGVALFQAGYTTEKEAEADVAGLALMVKAGYDPSAAVDVQRRFDLLYGRGPRAVESPVEELARVPFDALREYFRTHPPSRERIATIEREIARRGYRTAAPRKPLTIRAIFLTERAAGLDHRGLYDRALALYEEAIHTDPEYFPPHAARLQTMWRSGDTAGIVSAAPKVLERSSSHVPTWLVFSRALAREVTDPRLAAQRLREWRTTLRTPPGAMAHWLITADIAALEYQAGRPDALEEFNQLLWKMTNAVEEENLHRRLAWSFYLYGRLPEAERELRTGLQQYPERAATHHALGWVLTEMGRQADAQSELGLARRGDSDGSDFALEAVILWRIDERDRARDAFRQAVEKDAVWMSEKWIRNQYPPGAASVLMELRTAEVARRRLEELRRGRPAARP